MDDDEQALEYRFCLFFDFLGASNAAKTWPRERVHEFVDLLISIAHIESAEEISGAAMDDGGYRISVTPEVTTFSDNIVVSYRGMYDEDHPGKLDSFWTGVACKDAVRILAGVAEMGLRIGLILRGGLTYGQLYHQNGVVFGEALVEAVELEKAASLPRVLVAESVLSKLDRARDGDLAALKQDADGKWHLNYVAGMVRQSVDHEPPTPGHPLRWKTAHTRRIHQEIEALCSTDIDGSRRRKWEWFKKEFELEAAEISGEFSE